MYILRFAFVKAAIHVAVPLEKGQIHFYFFALFRVLPKVRQVFVVLVKKVVSEHVFKFIGGTHVKNKNTAVVQRGVNLIKRRRQVFPFDVIESVADSRYEIALFFKV